MSSFTVYDVMPGCKLVECREEVILIGVPPEVVKAIALKKLPGPTAIIIPDRLVIGTALQNATEFPLYHFLFVSGAYGTGAKLKMIGYSYQLKNNDQLLRLSLLGPSTEEMIGLGINPLIIKMLRQEANFFALKNKKNEVLPISSFIDNYPFDKDNQVNFGQVHVRRKDFNFYEISFENDTIEVDVNTNKIQEPPYSVQVDFIPNELSKFGVEILGGSTGFSPTSPSSGLMFIYNGICLLIDCIPYLNEQLHARGLAKSQITALFLSHIHDDHCNLLPLMLGNHKIKIMTTKEIYWMAMAKMSLMMNLPIKNIMHYFDFLPIKIGEYLDYYGLKIDAHYAVHSIPTIGSKFSLHHKQQNYSVLMTSDNQSLEDLEKMYEQKIVDEKRKEKIYKVYTEKVDILFADGGEGLLHGSAKDALNSKASRVIFFHIDKLPGFFDTTFSLASVGKQYVVVQGDNDFYTTRAIGILINYFHKIDISWISVLMGNMQIIRYNTEDVIIRQGDYTENKIYIILTGYCKVVLHDGKQRLVLAHKEAGDLFGEMAVTTGEHKRNASVVASSPVTLCELSEEIFYSLILEKKFRNELIDRWNIHSALEKIPFFSCFHHQILNKLSLKGKVLSLNKGDFLDNIDQVFYIILEGIMEIEDKIEENSKILKKGQFFGYYGYNEKKKIKVNVVDQTKVLFFDDKIIKNILNQTPALLFYLNYYNNSSFNTIPFYCHNNL